MPISGSTITNRYSHTHKSQKNIQNLCLDQLVIQSNLALKSYSFHLQQSDIVFTSSWTRRDYFEINGLSLRPWVSIQMLCMHILKQSNT